MSGDILKQFSGILIATRWKQVVRNMSAGIDGAITPFPENFAHQQKLTMLLQTTTPKIFSLNSSRFTRSY